MEGRKQVSSSYSSSSSLTSELFGSKESSLSSTGIFGSIFEPPSKVLGRESLNSEATERKLYSKNESWQAKPGADDSSKSSDSESQCMPNKDMSSIYQEQRVQPCHLSSSIYYGGQDIYSRPKSPQSSLMGEKMIQGVLAEETGGKGLSIIKSPVAYAYIHQGIRYMG